MCCNVVSRRQDRNGLCSDHLSCKKVKHISLNDHLFDSHNPPQLDLSCDLSPVCFVGDLTIAKSMSLRERPNFLHSPLHSPISAINYCILQLIDSLSS